MDIYEEIVELLGLESDPDLKGHGADEVESELLKKLEELNDRIRSLNREIGKVQQEIEEVRDDVSSHNNMAVESVKKEDEESARYHLRKKKNKIDKLENRESQLSGLKQNKERINDKRKEIEERLMDIRDMRRK